MIPDEAVEAAAKGIAAENMKKPWETMSEGVKETFRADAKAALEAAAPFLRAQALEDAATEFEANIGINEFDEQARRDGRPWNHIDDAWEHQGPYMDWLRTRAVTERGGE